MSVKLEKENIRLCESVCLPYCQTTVEGDVIVPDVKPDIQKILQVESRVVIDQKNIQSDKIYIQGTVKYNILYLPEASEMWSVKALSLSQEFKHSMDMKAGSGMEVSLDVDAGHPEYMLINSRKLNIRSKVGISARILGAKEIEIATGISEAEDIESKAFAMRVYNPKIDTLREMVIRERLEVPAGNSPIFEVLKVSAKACSTDLCMMENSALAKGELKICTLYCPEDETHIPEVMEHSAAFEERFEIEGLGETSVGEIEYMVKNISYEVCEDSDGDRRILSCEILLGATIRAFETLECQGVEDAYGKKTEVMPKKTAYRLEEMLDSQVTQKTINEPVALPEYLPAVHKLFECSGVPTIEDINICEDIVTVSGYITVNFLYLSGDKDMPVAGFSHVVPFNHSFEMKGLTNEAVCDAKAEVEYIGCTISSDRALQLRAIILIGVKAIAPRTAELVSDIQYCEEREIKKVPSIAVHFVQKGDTLWDVAKKYRTSMDAIISANGDESEIMVPGKCIYIFR